MKFVIGERGYGKTAYCIRWVLQGEPIDGYPGWSRGIICPDMNQVIHTTKYLKDSLYALLKKMREESTNQELWTQYGFHFNVPDYTHNDMGKAVWTFNEGERMQGMNRQVKLCIDEYGMLSDWQKYRMASTLLRDRVEFATLTSYVPNEIEYLERPDSSKALW